MKLIYIEMILVFGLKLTGILAMTYEQVRQLIVLMWVNRVTLEERLYKQRRIPEKVAFFQSDYEFYTNQ
jgi:hypothetical protein